MPLRRCWYYWFGDACAEDWYAFELAEDAVVSVTWLAEAQDEFGAWAMRLEGEEEDAEPLSVQEFAVDAWVLQQMGGRTRSTALC